MLRTAILVREQAVSKEQLPVAWQEKERRRQLQRKHSRLDYADLQLSPLVVDHLLRRLVPQLEVLFKELLLQRLQLLPNPPHPKAEMMQQIKRENDRPGISRDASKTLKNSQTL